nr:hypothetical protein [Tanacetum cinerariifolium]
MTKVVTTAATTITAAQVPKASAPRRKRGVVIEDPEETATASVIMHFEDNTVMRYQALKRKPVTEAQARRNMMIYLKNMVGFKMDFFKGEKEIEKEGSKRKGEHLNQDATKKQRINEDEEELKAHLQIVADDDGDDVYIEATPLALKSSHHNIHNYSDDSASGKEIPFDKIHSGTNVKQLVMSFASSTVTYTSVYTDSEPGRQVAPPSPDYIPSPEESHTPPVSQDEDEREPMFIQLHNPDYVPELMYPKYIPLEDEHVLLAEEEPLPPIDSPTAESPGYVAKDDDDNDSSGDDADDEDEDEEEEEHLALADSAVVIPTVEFVTLPERTEPVIPPSSTDIATTRARITIWLQAFISLPPEAEVERILAMPTPPPSPLASLSPPSVGERLARDDVPETEMAPRKRLCLSTLSSRYEIKESSTARSTRGREIDYGFVSTLDAEARRRGIREVRYGIRDTWVDPTEAVPEIVPMTLGEDSRTDIAQRVTMDLQRVNLLMKDRIAHQETILIVQEEAYAA